MGDVGSCYCRREEQLFQVSKKVCQSYYSVHKVVPLDIFVSSFKPTSPVVISFTDLSSTLIEVILVLKYLLLFSAINVCPTSSLVLSMSRITTYPSFKISLGVANLSLVFGLNSISPNFKSSILASSFVMIPFCMSKYKLKSCHVVTNPLSSLDLL